MEVNISPFGAVTYAGNNVNLRCTATLTRVMIGTDVTVNITWTKNGLSFSGISGRVTVQEEMVSPTLFYNQLQFSPLSSSMDNGLYVCNVTLTPVQQQFVIGTAGIGSMVLNVVGKNCLCILSVTFSIQLFISSWRMHSTKRMYLLLATLCIYCFVSDWGLCLRSHVTLCPLYS